MAVAVVGGTVAAETSSAGEYGSVGHEQGDAVVYSCCCLWGHCCELLGGGIPEFGGELCGVIGEWDWVGLAADDKNWMID